jgi:drug/metabolite transporter, DME family
VHTRSLQIGYLCVVLAAALWASGASASKFLFNTGVTPFQLVQLRITTAAVVLFVWLFCRHRHLLRIDRKDIGYFLLLGTLGMAAVNIAYLFAISRLNVAAALVLEYLAPVFIAVYTGCFQREPISRWTGAAIGAAIGGCYLVVGAYNLSIFQMNLPGILSGLGAALAFAWWSVHGEYGMHRYNPWTVLFYALVVAGIVWNLLQPPLESFMHPYPPAAWGWVLYIAVGGTILPFGLYYEGINRIRATRASITSTLEPIMAGIFSFFFLGEVMAPLQILGGVLVIGAIVLLQLRQEQDAKAPAMIRAGSHRA